MALSALSTYDDVISQYRDNASWFGDNNVAKAKLFHEAVTFLKEWKPSAHEKGARGRERQEFNIALLATEQERVENWIMLNDPDRQPVRVVDYDLSDGRDTGFIADPKDRFR